MRFREPLLARGGGFTGFVALRLLIADLDTAVAGCFVVLCGYLFCRWSCGSSGDIKGIASR